VPIAMALFHFWDRNWYGRRASRYAPCWIHL